MTQDDFDEAVERLRREGRENMDDDAARVFVAAAQVLRQRLNLLDDQEWQGPTDAELADFLSSMTPRQRKLLKEIAEGLIAEPMTKH